MRDTHINNLLVTLIMSATLRCQVQRFYSFLTKRCVCVCVRALLPHVRIIMHISTPPLSLCAHICEMRGQTRSCLQWCICNCGGWMGVGRVKNPKQNWISELKTRSSYLSFPGPLTLEMKYGSYNSTSTCASCTPDQETGRCAERVNLVLCWAASIKTRLSGQRCCHGNCL